MMLDMIYLLLYETDESPIVRNTYITSPKIYKKILYHQATIRFFVCVNMHVSVDKMLRKGAGSLNFRLDRWNLRLEILETCGYKNDTVEIQPNLILFPEMVYRGSEDYQKLG